MINLVLKYIVTNQYQACKLIVGLYYGLTMNTNLFTKTTLQPIYTI